MSAAKIDTHHHFFPKVYLDAVGLENLAAVMPSRRAPDWSVERAIGMMDEHGIEEGILSVSAGPPLSNASDLLRRCNDDGAGLRNRHSGRFGQFASLPLPDIDASLREVAHCLDELDADGFIIFTNYDGHYLGEPMFRPLFAELNRRRALVFIHPTEPPWVPGMAPASVIEFPHETTRTATSLMLSGALRRFPNIRFILSHAGGTLPYLAPRIALSVSMMPGGLDAVGDPLEAMGSFYFDTALSAGPSTLAALAKIAQPDHILFGTDFPMAPLSAIGKFNLEIEALGVTPLSANAIFRGNAANLLGRARVGPPRVNRQAPA